MRKRVEFGNALTGDEAREVVLLRDAVSASLQDPLMDGRPPRL